MPVIKAKALAWGRLSAPDLDAQEAFLTDFGMIRAARTADALYMRGTDAGTHLHVTVKGETKVVGVAFHADSEADLAKLAQLPGASDVEAMDDFGGGKRVRLTDPNGYQVEVLHGVAELPAIPVNRDPTNSGADPLRRAGRLMRLPPSPAPIKRIGHCVFGTPKVSETVGWYRETLGLLRSDDIHDGPEDNVVGAFSRLDRGDEYVDHHVLFCVRNERAGLNHLSFEAPDIDAIMADHEYLAGLGKYEHMWGVGRHLLGSQVYDYWADPYGRVHERWADTDRLNASDGGHLLTPEQGFQSQWGERPPEKFIGHVSP
ncbi:MAG: VOC family protein [Alphaproteobacteria bacterium]